MASCSIFGGLVPNIYIDRIFLEESQRGVDTDNDGKDDLYLQTPSITVNLKILDTINSGGGFSILGDALEIQTKDGNLDFKKYFKVHCYLFLDQDYSEQFIDDFENKNYPTSLPLGGSAVISTTNYQAPAKNKNFLAGTSKTLNDFADTYVNQNGVTEIIHNFNFQLAEKDVLKYLRVFSFITLDTDTLSADLQLQLPTLYRRVVGKYADQLVMSSANAIDSRLTVFLDPKNNIWDGPFHIHNTTGGKIYMEGSEHTPDIPHNTLIKGTIEINNIQDFRIRDEIDIMIANLHTANKVQSTFPEQQDVLKRITSKNSYFSEFFVTKDEERKARFYFAFDYKKCILENTQFPTLVSKMSNSAKNKLLQNSSIIGFKLSRTQVQEQRARNSIGSPVRNKRLPAGSKPVPVVDGSLDDKSINEINILLPQQVSAPDSQIRHFTGIDAKMSLEEDGSYQYAVSVEINDGFISMTKDLVNNFSAAISEYERYVALTQIPGIYDEKARKFTATPEILDEAISVWGLYERYSASQRSGQEIMSEGAPNLSSIVNTYLNTLDFFVDIDRYSPASYPVSPHTARSAMSKNIMTMIDPVGGSIDGVLMFQNLMQDLLGIVKDVLSVGSNAIGVEATTSNRQSNSKSSFKSRNIQVSEVFENTIDARFINETYLDNIGLGPTRLFNGLRVYTAEQLSNTVPAEITPQNFYLEPEKELAKANITFKTDPVLQLQALSPFGTGEPLLDPTAPDTGGISTTKYLGQGSTGSVGNLNVNTLSPTDLSIDRVERAEASQFLKPSAAAFATFDRSGIMEGGIKKEELEVDFKTKINVLTSFSVVPRVAYTHMPTHVVKTYMIRNAVFETKKLSELQINRRSSRNTFYLCKQTRQSDKTVIDSYFLLEPPESVFASEITPIIEIEEPTITEGPAIGIDTTTITSPSMAIDPAIAADMAPRIDAGVQALEAFEDPRQNQPSVQPRVSSNRSITRRIATPEVSSNQPQPMRSGVATRGTATTTPSVEQGKAIEKLQKKTLKRDITDITKGGGYK
jgi:hypothetical protein